MASQAVLSGTRSRTSALGAAVGELPGVVGAVDAPPPQAPATTARMPARIAMRRAARARGVGERCIRERTSSSEPRTRRCPPMFRRRRRRSATMYRMRVALVHDYFTQLGGAERVVGMLHDILEPSIVAAAVVDRRLLPPGLAGRDVRSSRLQPLLRAGAPLAP